MLSGKTTLWLSLATLVGSAGNASSGESWVRVGSEGLGNPDRRVGHALAIHDGYVWVAAAADPSAEGGGRPRLFRARLEDDTAWTEVPPPWSANGEITDLEPFAGDLYVATTLGQVWRYRAGGWASVTPSWTATPVYALGVWRRPFGTATLCAARGARSIYCGLEGPMLMPLPGVPLTDSDDVGTADLVALRDQLFLAVSGASAGSRTCEVLRYDGRWRQVTADCFGDTERTWAGRMAAYGEHIYLGTGGHTLNAIYRINSAGEFTEVTPDFYDPAAGLRRVPAAAVAAGQLFLGTHVSYSISAGLAEVVRSDGTTWSRSAVPGFGSDSNLTTNALAGAGMQLYAATYNPIEGFEVWRRDYSLIDGIWWGARHYREFTRNSRWLETCLRRRPLPGCPGWSRVEDGFRGLRHFFDAARHPEDDAKLIFATRERLAAAGKALTAASPLAGSADKIARDDPAAARPLYDAAADRLDEARELTRSAWRTVLAALKAAER
jgi:hypothetical protein